jgi:hypothetical protein
MAGAGQPGQSGDRERGRMHAVEHTTQLVLARVLAPPASDAERRRCLGPDRVHPLEAGVRSVRGPRGSRAGALVLVLDGAGAGGPARERVADGHCVGTCVIGASNWGTTNTT